MSAKTATSILLEFCAQQKVAPPQYESVNDENGPSQFIVLVKAFDLIAKGSGQSKKEAKHAASRQLIDGLSQMEPYKQKLNVNLHLTPPPPPPPPEINNENFYGAILNLCLRYNLQQPSIDEISITGAGTHKPEFTSCCSLGMYKTYGKANTKKEARRQASAEMLKMMEALIDKEDTTSCDSIGGSSISSSEVVANVLPLMELPTVEEILAEYRRRKKPYLQPPVDGLRYRKNFFLNLPAADKCRAQQVLTDKRWNTPEEIVSQTCKVLKINYEIRSMYQPSNFKRFSFVDSKYDCVVIDHADKLFIKVADYFRTMLNIENPAEPSSINDNNNF